MLATTRSSQRISAAGIALCAAVLFCSLSAAAAAAAAAAAETFTVSSGSSGSIDEQHQRRLLRELIEEMPAMLEGAGGTARELLQAGGQQKVEQLLGTEMLKIPGGLDSLLTSNLMPEAVARAVGGGYLNTSDSSGGSTELETRLRGYKINLDDDRWADVNLNQAKLDANVLQLVADSVDLSTGVLAIISNALKVTSKTIGLGTKEVTTTNARVNFALKEYDFAQKLYGDINKQIDDSDYLGDAAKYVKLYNNLQAALSSGAMSVDLQTNLQQLQAASSVLSGLSSAAA